MTGSLSDLNADLPSLVYTPTSDINGTDDLELTILDNTDSLSGTSVQVGITINPLPLLSAPAGVTVTANGTFTFSSPNNIIVTDTAGAGNNNETLTLTVADGTLSLGTQTGLTVSGNGTTATPLTLSGPLSDLNADLTSLVYTPNSNFHGSDTLSLTILDTTDGAEGTPATVSITVNIVLNQPSVTNTTTVENTQSTTGLVITPNSLDTAFVTNFQITNITGGTLYLNDGVTQITDGEFITVAQGQAGLKFTPATNSLTAGNFTVQESTTADDTGLGGINGDRDDYGQSGPEWTERDQRDDHR